MDRYTFFQGATDDLISMRLRSSSKSQEDKKSLGKRKRNSDGEDQDKRGSKRAIESQPKSSSSFHPIIATVESMGNTSYVNSLVFYSFRFIPLFTNKLHDLVLNLGGLVAKNSKFKDSLELKLLRALHRNYLNMSQNECVYRMRRHPIKPSSFLSLITEFKDCQYYSAELLIKLLKSIEKCCDDLERVSATDCSADKASKLKSMCFYGDYFKGEERKSITCSACQTVNTNSIGTSVITLTVPANMTTEKSNNWITESLMKPKMLDEFKCEECQLTTSAKQECAYSSLPKIMIFHLKSVNENSSGSNTKVTRHIPMPLELDCFCYSCQKGDPNPEHKYHLNSIVVHIGRNCSTGHYIAFVRSLVDSNEKKCKKLQNNNCCHVDFNPSDKDENVKNVWLKCNNHFVSVFNWTAVQRFFNDNKYRSPHLLFYVRNDMVVECPS